MLNEDCFDRTTTHTTSLSLPLKYFTVPEIDFSSLLEPVAHAYGNDLFVVSHPQGHEQLSCTLRLPRQ